jgi:hypothetical protein
MKKNKYRQTIYKRETKRSIGEKNDILKNYETGMPKKAYLGKFILIHRFKITILR